MKTTRVILEVEKAQDLGFPHNNDVIVYDGAKKCWYQTTKDELLESERKEIKRQSEEIKQFKEEITNDLLDFENKTSNDMAAYKAKIDGVVTKLLNLVEPLVKQGGKK